MVNSILLDLCVLHYYYNLVSIIHPHKYSCLNWFPLDRVVLLFILHLTYNFLFKIADIRLQRASSLKIGLLSVKCSVY